ncbi:MAG TPA: hypothetical protein VGA31_10600 [Thermoanaerobaculia bacterium]
MKKTPQPAARIAVLLVLALCLIFAVYLAAANILLSGGRLSSLINDGPNETWVGYESASSVWPGRARAKNVLVRDRDAKAEWAFVIEEARFSFSVLDLLRRRFHVTSLRGNGLTFHARNRLTREEAADRRRVALLPPIPGFPDPPLLVPGEKKTPPTGQEWNIRIDDIDVRPLREIWVDAYRYGGDGRVTGAFFLQPKVQAQVFRSTLTTRGGILRSGDESLAKDVTATLGCVIDAWDPMKFPGSRMLRFVTGETEARARLDSPELVQRVLGELGGVKLQTGKGRLAVRGAVEHGVASATVDHSVPDVALRIFEVRLRGKLEARGELSQVNLERGGFHLNGGYVKLSDATISEGAGATRSWWTRLDFAPGDIRSVHSTVLTTTVSVRARNAKPFLALIHTKLPAWTGKLFDLEGLAGRARLKLGKSLAEVRGLTARVGDFYIDGEYQARGAFRNGTFLIKTGVLSLGIGVNGATTEYRFLGAHSWFRERAGREPTSD